MRIRRKVVNQLLLTPAEIAQLMDYFGIVVDPAAKTANLGSLPPFFVFLPPRSPTLPPTPRRCAAASSYYVNHPPHPSRHAALRLATYVTNLSILLSIYHVLARPRNLCLSNP